MIIIMNPEIWHDPKVRRALARHDIGAFYSALVESGMQQRQIAAITGQRQADVSEIIKGRKVTMYDVLERIAKGFGIPRGWMGLASTDDEEVSTAYPGTGDEPIDPRMDDEMISRRFLGMASIALLGSAVVGEAGGYRLLSGPPSTLGNQDVKWIMTMTDRIWSLDLQHGGGAAFAAARGTAQQVVGGLRASAASRDLQVAAAHLCRAAAWSSFDAGQRRSYWQLQGTALELARQAGDTKSVLTIVGDAGRAHILSGNHRDAAKLFELTAMRKRPDAVAWGLTGSAYAPNSPVAARDARDRIKESEGGDSEAATSMFGHVSLDIGEYADAVEAYEAVVPQRSGRLAVQESAPLAIAYIQSGERAVGLRQAERVITLAEQIRSTQCNDAMKRLAGVLRTQNDSTAQDMAHRLTSV